MKKFFCTPNVCGPVNLFLFEDTEVEKTLRAFHTWMSWDKFIEDLPLIVKEKQVNVIVFPNTEYSVGLAKTIDFMGVEIL